MATINAAYYYMSMMPFETKKKPKQLCISLQGAISRDGSILIDNGGKDIRVCTKKLELLTQYPPALRINQVAACDRALFALDSYGSVWANGHHTVAGLGRTEGIQSFTTPTKIEFIYGVQHIAAGAEHAVAVTTSREVYAWGSVPLCGHGKDKGVDLPGSCDFIHSPIRVKSLSSIVQVSCGKYHTIVLDSKGKLHAWGSNKHGQLGIGPKRIFDFSHRPFYKTERSPNAENFFGGTPYDILDFVDSPKSVRLPRSVEVGQICCADETSIALALDGSVFLWYAYVAASSILPSFVVIMTIIPLTLR